MYSAVAGVPAQLDFYRRGLRPHNGMAAICYRAKRCYGASAAPADIKWSAEFDLGLAQTREGLRLVAASECRAGGCSEVPLPVWRIQRLQTPDTTIVR